MNDQRIQSAITNINLMRNADMNMDNWNLLMSEIDSEIPNIHELPEYDMMSIYSVYAGGFLCANRTMHLKDEQLIASFVKHFDLVASRYSTEWYVHAGMMFGTIMYTPTMSHKLNSQRIAMAIGMYLEMMTVENI